VSQVLETNKFFWENFLEKQNKNKNKKNGRNVFFLVVRLVAYETRHRRASLPWRKSCMNPLSRKYSLTEELDLPTYVRMHSWPAWVREAYYHVINGISHLL
jgi:hypothetical protein